MIVDRLENWKLYFCAEDEGAPDFPWKFVFDYLASLTPETPDCEMTELVGKDIRASVMTYETKSPESGMIEAHNEHIDIQMSLKNAERIDWYQRDGLKVKTPYDADDDIAFFEVPEMPGAIVNNAPGQFMVLFPEDGHVPGLMTGKSPETVKKVVVKLRKDLVME